MKKNIAIAAVIILAFHSPTFAQGFFKKAAPAEAPAAAAPAPVAAKPVAEAPAPATQSEIPIATEPKTISKKRRVAPAQKATLAKQDHEKHSSSMAVSKASLDQLAEIKDIFQKPLDRFYQIKRRQK